jgi:AraC-like DNA-binding protein
LANPSVVLVPPRFINVTEIKENTSTWFKQHKNVSYTEILFIQNGYGEFNAEEKFFFGQEGDLIIFNADGNIEGRSSLDYPLKGIAISFSHLHIIGKNKGCLTDFADLPIIHLQEEKSDIFKNLSEILSEYMMKNDGYQDTINSLLQLLIVKTFRLLKHTQNNSNSSVCQTVKRFIEDNYNQDLTLNDLANLVFVSPYHLVHIFKEEVGLPPIQYLIHYRIEQAKRLLGHSGLTVNEIAATIGYENANYFNLLFKKMTGKPPGKYRKSKN